VNRLKELTLLIKSLPRDKRNEELIAQLRSLRVSGPFQLPLEPTVVVTGFDFAQCRVLDSAKVPLYLSLKNCDVCAESYHVIFKHGDDLRQDVLTMQVLTLMDQMWKEKGLDLRLTRYRVLNLGGEFGMIQVVRDALTACKIQKEQAGVITGALKQTTLASWLQQQNPNPADYTKAVQNFVASCAGYCVATFVLGVGDRHNDNIMVDRYGHLFHIDFGHFLGNFKVVAGIFNRDKAPFVLPPEFVVVMGGKDSLYFAKFIDLACKAYNIVRANANIFLNLFAMMLSTGIPELRSKADIEYLRDTLQLNLTDEEAAEYFKRLIYLSLNTKTTRLNFLIHMWVHNK
jgi:phosphatidylinositol-4,5-bisphosphate 3-kinase